VDAWAIFGLVVVAIAAFLVWGAWKLRKRSRPVPPSSDVVEGDGPTGDQRLRQRRIQDDPPQLPF